VNIMPNLIDEHDHNFGAIEAAVRETARGRAFLADYAKRVRQSDILTLLATIGRLERWCQQQAERITEIEGRRPTADEWPGERWRPLAIKHRSNSFRSSHGNVDHSLDVAPEQAGPAREAAYRVEHLATTLDELDQKVADLADEGLSPCPRQLDGPAATTVVDSMVLDSGLLPLDVEYVDLPDVDAVDDGLEEEVLSDIAKALGSPAG
jgi:hypothetical protein